MAATVFPTSSADPPPIETMAMALSRRASSAAASTWAMVGSLFTSSKTTTPSPAFTSDARAVSIIPVPRRPGSATRSAALPKGTSSATTVPTPPSAPAPWTIRGTRSSVMVVIGRGLGDVPDLAGDFTGARPPVKAEKLATHIEKRHWNRVCRGLRLQSAKQPRGLGGFGTGARLRSASW